MAIASLRSGDVVSVAAKVRVGPFPPHPASTFAHTKLTLCFIYRKLDSIRGDLVRRATTEGVETRETSRTAIVRLRMLDDVGNAARLWNAYRGARGGGVFFSKQNAVSGSNANALAIAKQAATSSRHAWRARVGALAQRSYRIAEPLLALHGVVLRELGDDEELVAHLAETASLARKAGEEEEGLRFIHQARALVARHMKSLPARTSRAQSQVPDTGLACVNDEDDPYGFARHAMSSPLARWRLEEAKLLWASGRDRMAIAAGRTLLEATSPGTMAFLRVSGSSAGVHPTRRGSGSSIGGAQSQQVGHQDVRFYEIACLISKWQGATRTESSKSVIETHASIVRGVNGVSVAARTGQLRLPPSSRNVPPGQGQMHRMLRRAHFRLAQFADNLYTQATARLSSPEWSLSEKLRARNEEELASLKLGRAQKRARLGQGGGNGAAGRDPKMTREEALAVEEEIRVLHRRIFPLEKQVLLDREETGKLKDDRVKWLLIALQAYRRCLEAGSTGGLGTTGASVPPGSYQGGSSMSSSGADQRVVFRIVDIWFSVCGSVDGFQQKTFGGNGLVEKVNEDVAKLVQRSNVPSWNFLPLSYQICGRLGTESVPGNEFSAVLRQLVDRMAGEHPYHVLYHVQALKRGDRVGGAGPLSESYSAPRQKIEAAKDVLECFARHSKHHGNMVSQMDVMIEAYIELARHTVDAGRGASDGSFQIPTACKKRALRDLDLVPIVTANVPVDPTMRYATGSFPSFVNFEDTCRLVGGINQPKLVNAFGSDGVAYKQLAKAGNDDLRQDAVGISHLPHSAD